MVPGRAWRGGIRGGAGRGRARGAEQVRLVPPGSRDARREDARARRPRGAPADPGEKRVGAGSPADRVRGVQAGFHHLGIGRLHREVPRHEGVEDHRTEAAGGEMTVLSLLSEAIFGKKLPDSTPEVSLAGALTSGFYEVSQAMNTTAGDVQNSLDLIASAATSILRMARVVILLKEPGEEMLAVRAMAGIPRGRRFEEYRQEIHDSIFSQILSSGAGMLITEARAGADRKLLRPLLGAAGPGVVVA